MKIEHLCDYCVLGHVCKHRNKFCKISRLIFPCDVSCRFFVKDDSASEEDKEQILSTDRYTKSEVGFKDGSQTAEGLSEKN